MTAATCLHLPEVLDTRAAAGLLQDLTDRRGADLSLDGSAVQRLGGQCLQILLAAQKAWEADCCTLLLTAPSPELADALALLGVDPASPFLQQEHPK